MVFLELSEYLYDILGKSYLGAKRYEEAADAYKQMANLAKFDQMQEMAEKGIRQAYTEGKLYEKQIPEQLQKIKENPDDLDAHFALAESYELSEEVDEAIAQYQKISELQPDDAQWHKKDWRSLSNAASDGRSCRGYNTKACPETEVSRRLRIVLC